MNGKKRKKIEYGEVDIPKESFAPEKTKVRISMMVRGDILDQYKLIADQKGVGYQVLMQIALAEYLENSTDKRLEKLENVILKKNA